MDPTSRTNQSPRVSVIIIFFNAARFIQEAIESVLAQTYHDWELRLVDDGSTDASTAIACDYAKQFPERIRYLEHAGHRNCGKVASRNRGMQCARGNYIAFLDADDVWLPRKLEHQVALLEAHSEAVMVYGQSQYWHSWQNRASDFSYELGVSPNTLFKPRALFIDFFVRQTAAIPPPSDILLQREIVEEVGGFDESFDGINNVYEDQAFIAKVCLNASIFASSECWTKYRQHPDSSCAVMEKRGHAETTRLYFLNWLMQYLSDQETFDEEIWRGLRQQRWELEHPHLSRGWKNARSIAQQILPVTFRRWLWAKRMRADYVPPVGSVRFGNLRRVTPLSRDFGYDRGTPIDRYYIEKFLAHHAADIHGRVLEIADNSYTHRFGGEYVTQSDVLHIEANENATIVGDLTHADHIPCDAFDCVIVTQTLQLIYDVPAALCTIHRILKPGGVALATVPGISQISRYDADRWGYYWSFTPQSMQRLFEHFFPKPNVDIESHGNVLTASSFLFGLATQELHPKELDYADQDYPLVITIRAVKASS